MEYQDNKVMFRYNGIKERKLIPKHFNFNNNRINYTRYGLNNNFKNIENMTNNQKLYRSRINLISKKYKNTRHNIENIVNQMELNNFNIKYTNKTNLENENKLYNFLLDKKRIKLGYLDKYCNSGIIDNKNNILYYIVNELKIKSKNELNKLYHIVDLILDDYIKNDNKILLKNAVMQY